MQIARMTAISLLLLIAGCGPAMTQLPPEEAIAYDAVAAWRAEAYAPGRAETVEHRLTDLQPIFAEPAQAAIGLPFPSVRVAATVGPDGRVLSARIVSAREGVLGAPQTAGTSAQALAQVRSLRFAPFTVEGRPVTAHVEMFIPLVESRTPPPPSRTFPEGSLADTRVVLSRTGCFGSCPAYTVTIEGSGEVTWQGEAYVAQRGAARGSIEPSAVAALLDRARAAGFFDLKDVYRADITDGATYTVTITHGGLSKTVEDYDGALVGMPWEVTLLEQAIDRAARTAQWIGPDQRP